MCEQAEQKRLLRPVWRGRRSACGSGQKDVLIAQNFFRSPFAEAESFFVYYAVRGEAATAEIIAELLKRGKRVCLPRIAEGKMLAAPYARLIKGTFGIMEPITGEDMPCAVALVPMLAFDGAGYRLGYGGGYYDRYFAEHPAILRVGLAYAGQATDLLPREETDIPLHAVVTEEGTKLFAKS